MVISGFFSGFFDGFTKQDLALQILGSNMNVTIFLGKKPSVTFQQFWGLIEG